MVFGIFASTELTMTTSSVMPPDQPADAEQLSRSHADRKKRRTLQEHMEATYFNLRYGLLIIAAALLLMPLIARVFGGVPLQGSLSAYYHASDGAYRNLFVGALVAVGAMLYLYKGFSRDENYVLNLAGSFAVGVAMIPMQWNCGDTCAKLSIHGTVAVAFFICIAYVCLFRASDTLELLRDKSQIQKYKRTYRTFGVLMILSPIAAVLVSIVVPSRGPESTRILMIEEFGVAVFGAYWLAKTSEMRKTNAERLALRGRARREHVTDEKGGTKEAVVLAQ